MASVYQGMGSRIYESSSYIEVFLRCPEFWTRLLLAYSLLIGQTLLSLIVSIIQISILMVAPKALYLFLVSLHYLKRSGFGSQR